MTMTLRLAYALIAAATCVGAGPALVAGDVSLAALLLAAGILGACASAWVRSEHVGRGAVASVGIVVGPLPLIGVAFIAVTVMSTYGSWGSAVLAATVMCLAAAIIPPMWRLSRRPWDPSQPVMDR